MESKKVKKSEGTNSLYGLVLTGGHSTRMEKDKSLLSYYGKSQAEYCYDLLSGFCQKTFISNREEQSQLSEHKNLPQIHDTFFDMGPLGGILSAMSKHSNTAWLVLACDLPFVDTKTIEALIRQRNLSKIATAYKSTKDPYFPEPLCTIYEPKAIFVLKEFVDRGIHCPRKILINSDTHLIEQDYKSSLDNINNAQEYRATIDLISKSKHE